MTTTAHSAIHRISIFITLLLYFPLLLNAQVKIKEHVDINPLPKTLQVQNASDNSDRTVTIQFSAETDADIRLVVWRQCGPGAPPPEQVVYGRGFVTASFTYTGPTIYSPQISSAAAWENVPFHIGASIGSRTLVDTTGTMFVEPCMYGGFSCGTSGIELILSDLDYHIWNSEICSGADGLITLQTRYNPCAPGTFDAATEKVTLTVVQGEDLGGFTTSNNGQDAEKSIILSLQNLNYHTMDVRFVAADTLPPGVIVDTAKIQIKAGSITDTMSLVVRACSRGTSFELSVEKPRISVRTQDNLSVQPVMDDNSTIVWDKNTDPVNYTITSGSEYGWLAVNGQKQEGTSLTVQGTQLDQLSFLACDSLPPGVTEGAVTIQAESKGIVKTASLIVTPKPSLKLILSVGSSSITYGDYTSVDAQTYNVETGMPEAPPYDVTYTFALTGGSQFARFWMGESGSVQQGTAGDNSANILLSRGQNNSRLGIQPKMQESNSQETEEYGSKRLLIHQKRKALLRLKKPALKIEQTQNSIAMKISGTRTTNNIADDGGPDVLSGVSQEDGYACAIPEATDQEPVNPEGEIVQVTVSASDETILPANAEFRVMPTIIKVTVTPSTIKQGEQATISVQKKNESGVYEDLSANEYVAYELTKGYSAGELSSPNGSETGGYIEGHFQSVTFTAKVDVALPNDNPVRISVYTNYGAGLGKLTVTKERTFDHLVVIATPDTIIHGQSSIIKVFAVDAVGQEVTIDENATITFVASPDGYGAFILDGSIPYSQAKSDVMRYNSVDQKISGSGYQQIKITASGGGKSGVDSLTIKNKPCEDAPQCIVAPALPIISLKELKRGDMQVDPCSQPLSQPGTIVGGGFKPLNTFENFDIQPCFNSETGFWQFSISEIIERVFLDLCESNIAGAGKVFINSIYEIPPGDECTALRDFKDHVNYPVGDATLGPLDKRPIKYLIRPVLYKHEEIHKKQYQEILQKLKPDFEKDILSYKPRCEEGKSIEDVISNAKIFISSYLINYLDKANKIRSEKSVFDPLDPYKDERIKVQGSPEYLAYLQTYIDALKKIAPYCIQ